MRDLKDEDVFLTDDDFSLGDIHLGSAFQNHELDGDHFKSMRNLTDKDRAANALPLPPSAGQRVEFKANLGSVMSYDDPPSDKMRGTVVLVRTGSGDATFQDDRVFVQYDNGKFLPTLAEHLRPAPISGKRASAVVLRVADLGDLTNFLAGPTAGQNDLVHMSTKDLWAVHQDNNGYVIERLFDETGEPLKV